MNKDTEWGQISVHDDVLAALAGAAALSVPGVAQMVARHHGDDTVEKISQEDLARGVVITMDSIGMVVDISLMVRYGVKIKDVGLDVIRAVQRAMWDAVATRPNRIVIHVEGVRK